MQQQALPTPTFSWREQKVRMNHEPLFLLVSQRVQRFFEQPNNAHHAHAQSEKTGGEE